MDAGTRTLHPASFPKAVALWTGFNSALLLSTVVIAVGTVLVLARNPMSDLQGRVHGVIEPLPSADSIFWWIVSTVLRFAKRTTRIAQSGSLPTYVMIVLGVTVAAIAVPVASSIEDLPRWVDSPAQLAPLSFVVVAAIGAALARRRIAAALLLGAAGYGMAGLYVINGAPDLALTQFAIETLATVLFVLVLRALPRDFDKGTNAVMAPIRVVVSALVGIGVFGFALVATQARESVPEPSISEEMLEHSVPDGYGSNVVNVILVDFRGMDSLGEITVLAVAALGTVALASSISRKRRGDAIEDSSTERSQVVDAITRLLFASIAVLATYFLFAGHNQPGGGFVGGLTVGAAISLRYVAGGAAAVRNSIRVPARLVLGGGLGVSLLTAFVPLALGGTVLEHASLSLKLPVLGDVKTTSALPFDIGVFLVVVGLVLMAIEAFGSESDAGEGSHPDPTTIRGRA